MTHRPLEEISRSIKQANAVDESSAITGTLYHTTGDGPTALHEHASAMEHYQRALTIFPRSSASSLAALGTSPRNDRPHPANAALEMFDSVSKPITECLPDMHEVLLEDLRAALPEGIRVRLGVHCGTDTAGVISTSRMQHDAWGDTVNVASRMERTGEAGRFHVSEQCALLLSPDPSHLRERGGNVSNQQRGESRVIPSRSPERSEGGSEEPGTWHTEVKPRQMVKA